jgi:hypothetical protein
MGDPYLKAMEARLNWRARCKNATKTPDESAMGQMPKAYNPIFLKET